METKKKHWFKVYGEITGPLTGLEQTLGTRNITEKVFAESEDEAKQEVAKKFGAVITRVERCPDDQPSNSLKSQT
jgi:hypothetical protein